MKISKKVFAKYEVPRIKCPLTEKNTKYYGDTLEKGFFFFIKRKDRPYQ